MTGRTAESAKFPVDFPFSGKFLETISDETASTAINRKGPNGPFLFMVKCADLVRTPVCRTLRFDKPTATGEFGTSAEGAKPRRGHNTPQGVVINPSLSAIQSG